MELPGRPAPDFEHVHVLRSEADALPRLDDAVDEPVHGGGSPGSTRSSAGLSNVVAAAREALGRSRRGSRLTA